ncbi:helix-turn-helix domain-containing protein [Clostridium novyi]|uniref:helix-turn-helix domain-containing protein n=1 Tax=Clostridium novyi TaxID=1542 RepID=UPI00057D7348|nr:helix-turn-helix transcriptional regulator [Clostridium novyi]
MKLEFQLHIKEFRLKFGLSQKKLAVKAGLTQSYIAKLESNNREKSPTLNSMYAISKALNVCPYSIVTCKNNCDNCILKKY